MNIQSVNKAAEALVKNTGGLNGKNDTPFKSFFDTAMSNLEETNSLIQTADKMSVDFALGKIDNVADVMIAQEKASTALQYTIQIRNKLLDAYNEIMRMQV